MRNPTQHRWLFFTRDALPSALHVPRHHPLLSAPDRWRRSGKQLGLSKSALHRLEWFIWYETTGNRNARKTCRHFGIAPKTFYGWKKRFDSTNLRLLEERTRAPHHVRQKTYTPTQYLRIVTIRKAHLRYGKAKLFWLYRTAYPEDATMSLWKVQCIIEASGLYAHPRKQAQTNRKRARSGAKKRISELKRKRRTGFLLCLDTALKSWNGSRRTIFTAVDAYSKLGFARMYPSKSSLHAEDFLKRLHLLLDGRIENVGHDNGSEFQGNFRIACERLTIPQYHSRVRTPKDNAMNERFNRTLTEEFLQFGNMTSDIPLFNRRLTEWLIEYNFHRPHQALDYLPPINFHYKYHKVLPMCPSNTLS